jgi:hypothetical protein
MKQQHHFDPSPSSRELARISALISDLNRAVRYLDNDIASEEERARASKRLDPILLTLVGTLVVRRDNLKDTIGALEQRLADFQDRVELEVFA